MDWGLKNKATFEGRLKNKAFLLRPVPTLTTGRSQRLAVWIGLSTGGPCDRRFEDNAFLILQSFVLDLDVA